jgi:hypothetical protein
MGLPPAFWRRASLSSETRPAKSGVLALVPPIAATCPPMTMLKPSPSAATARAGNRRFWLLSALHANTKSGIQKPIHYGKREGRLTAPGGPGPSGLPRPAVLTAAAGGKGSSCEVVFR